MGLDDPCDPVGPLQVGIFHGSVTPIISVGQAAVFRALSDGAAGAAEVFLQASLCPVLQLHIGDIAVCHGEAPCYTASSTDVASSEGGSDNCSVHRHAVGRQQVCFPYEYSCLPFP